MVELNFERRKCVGGTLSAVLAIISDFVSFQAS